MCLIYWSRSHTIHAQTQYGSFTLMVELKVVDTLGKYFQ